MISKFLNKIKSSKNSGKYKKITYFLLLRMRLIIITITLIIIIMSNNKKVVAIKTNRIINSKVLIISL